jgi:hypothetical protein
MQTNTNKNNFKIGTERIPFSLATVHTPNVNPITAKGKAKTVWEKVTNCRYRRIFSEKLMGCMPVLNQINFE